MSPTVYLAGPITGYTYEGCTDWREFAIDELAEVGIIGLSPMRAKAYLKGDGIIQDTYAGTVMSGDRGITTRDRMDCTGCDLLLVNLLGAERVSIGTMIELGWADANRIPIITVIDPSGNIHDHGMVRDVTGFRVDTLDQGIHVAKAILTAYTGRRVE